MRNDKRTVVVGLLHQPEGYVQAQADATPENAASPSSRAAASRCASRPCAGPRAFAAKPGAVSGIGEARRRVSAGRRSSYEWQYSTDGGKTWILAPVTLQAKTTISGLAAGSTVVVPVPRGHQGGEGDWSQAVTLLVK